MKISNEILEIDRAAMEDVLVELARARLKFGGFVNAHEGYAVIKEEFDELWDAVRMQYGDKRNEEMRKEAIQVAAMALRFVTDLR